MTADTPDPRPVSQPAERERLADWMMDHLPEYHRWMMTGWRETMRDEAVVLAGQMLNAAGVRLSGDDEGLRDRIHQHRDGCNGRPHRRWYRGENKCDTLAALAAPPATEEPSE